MISAGERTPAEYLARLACTHDVQVFVRRTGSDGATQIVATCPCHDTMSRGEVVCETIGVSRWHACPVRRTFVADGKRDVLARRAAVSDSPDRNALLPPPLYQHDLDGLDSEAFWASVHGGYWLHRIPSARGAPMIDFPYPTREQVAAAEADRDALVAAIIARNELPRSAGRTLALYREHWPRLPRRSRKRSSTPTPARGTCVSTAPIAVTGGAFMASGSIASAPSSAPHGSRSCSDAGAVPRLRPVGDTALRRSVPDGGRGAGGGGRPLRAHHRPGSRLGRHGERAARPPPVADHEADDPAARA